jgi:site-specific recombinase
MISPRPDFPLEVEGAELVDCDGATAAAKTPASIAEDIADRLNEDDQRKGRTDGRFDSLVVGNCHSQAAAVIIYLAANEGLAVWDR